MHQPAFPDAALVLVGHGSTVNEDSSATVRQHAAELRRRGSFAEVLEAFWKVEPKLETVWTRVTARRVFVVPLFVSEGFFTREAIPRALGLRAETEAGFGRALVVAGRLAQYCAPVGTHPRMAAVILARAEDIGRRFPFPRPPTPAETTLLIVGHGTGRNANSRRSVEDRAAEARRAGRFAEVRAAFMLEDPRVTDWPRLAPTRNVVVVPFFMADGLHVREDIPVLLGEPERVVKARVTQGLPSWRNPTEKHGKLVWYAESVGSAPQLTDVILERVAQAAAA